jgi:hypothetical protein
VVTDAIHGALQSTGVTRSKRSPYKVVAWTIGILGVAAAAFTIFTTSMQPAAATTGPAAVNRSLLPHTSGRHGGQRRFFTNARSRMNDIRVVTFLRGLDRRAIERRFRQITPSLPPWRCSRHAAYDSAVLLGQISAIDQRAGADVVKDIADIPKK